MGFTFDWIEISQKLSNQLRRSTAVYKNVFKFALEHWLITNVSNICNICYPNQRQTLFQTIIYNYYTHVRWVGKSMLICQVLGQIFFQTLKPKTEAKSATLMANSIWEKRPKAKAKVMPKWQLFALPQKKKREEQQNFLPRSNENKLKGLGNFLPCSVFLSIFLIFLQFTRINKCKESEWECPVARIYWLKKKEEVIKKKLWASLTHPSLVCLSFRP